MVVIAGLLLQPSAPIVCDDLCPQVFAKHDLLWELTIRINALLLLYNRASLFAASSIIETSSSLAGNV